MTRQLRTVFRRNRKQLLAEKGFLDRSAMLIEFRVLDSMTAYFGFPAIFCSQAHPVVVTVVTFIRARAGRKGLM